MGNDIPGNVQKFRSRKGSRLKANSLLKLFGLEAKIVVTTVSNKDSMRANSRKEADVSTGF